MEVGCANEIPTLGNYFQEHTLLFCLQDVRQRHKHAQITWLDHKIHSDLCQPTPKEDLYLTGATLNVVI